MKKTFALLLVGLSLFSACSDDDPIEPAGEIYEDILAYYPFDGDARDIMSEKKNLLEFYPLPTIDHSGNSSGALFFNGENAFLTSRDGDHNFFNPENELSISLWVRLDDVEQDQCMLSKMESGGYEITYTPEPSGKFNFRCFLNGTIYQISSIQTIEISKWYHIVACLRNSSAGSKLMLYINGDQQEILSLDATKTISPSQCPLVIAGKNDYWGLINLMTGAIDELIFYNKALTPKEINLLYTSNSKKYYVISNICEGEEFEFGGEIHNQSGVYIHTFKSANNTDSIVFCNLIVHQLYNIETNIIIYNHVDYLFGDSTINSEGTYFHKFQSYFGCDSLVTIHVTLDEYDLTTGLIAYYQLDGNGTDNTSYEHHLDDYYAIPANDRNDNYNSAMSFNGYSSAMESSFNDVDFFNPTGDFSISLWTKMAEIEPRFQSIISKAQSGGYSIDYYGSQSQKFHWAVNLNGTYYRVSANEKANSGIWYHLVGVFEHLNDSTFIKFYVDGKYQSSLGFSGFYGVRYSGVPIAIGANPEYSGFADFYNGIVDDVRIYNIALNSDVIYCLFATK